MSPAACGTRLQHHVHWAVTRPSQPHAAPWELGFAAAAAAIAASNSSTVTAGASRPGPSPPSIDIGFTMVEFSYPENVKSMAWPGAGAVPRSRSAGHTVTVGGLGVTSAA